MKNKKREITIIIISSMVLALFFSGDSIAKGFQKTDINVNADIAEPILIVEHPPTIEFNGKKDIEYYNFKVKNYNEKEEVTPIDLTYYIEIISQTKEISFKLYKNNQEISLENNGTTKMELQKENKQEDDYQLEIIYDKTKNYSMNNITQEVLIKVHAEQMKM